MSISGIDTTAQYLNTIPTAPPVAGVPDTSASGTTGVAGHHHHHHGGGAQFMQDVLAALKQSGVNLATPGTGSGSGSGTDQDGDNDGSANSGAQSVNQNMRQFMHDLFTAVKQSTDSGNTAGGGDGTGQAAAVSTGYAANLNSALQGMLQNLNSGNPSGNAALSSLQQDFQNLVAPAQNLSGTADGSSSNSADTQNQSLQAFLTNLLNSLKSQTGVASAAVGGLVSTST